MKTFFTLCFYMLLTSLAFGQTAPLDEWHFSIQSEPYTSLSTENLMETTDWQYQEWDAPISFDFYLENDLFTSVKVTSLGSLRFDTPEFEAFYFVSPFSGNLSAHPTRQSAMRYRTVGNFGERRLVVEYENFYPRSSLDTSDVVNCKVILHEGTNHITFHYGEVSISNWEQAFDIAQSAEIAAYRVDGITEEYRGLFLGGSGPFEAFPFDGSFPTAEMTITGVPANGMQFWLSETELTGPTATRELPEVFGQLRIAPNPVADVAYIDLELQENASVNLHLFDLTGRRLQTIDQGRLAAGDHRLELSVDKLPTGLYLLRVQAGEHELTRKILKK